VSRPTILRVPPLSPQLHDTVGERYDAVDPADLPARAADVVGIVSSNAGQVDSDLIASLPNLGVIANHGVGYDNIDVPVALARGVAVSNTPEVLDDAVAETAIALLLAVRREVVAADRFVREGRWPAGAFPLTAQVAGSRVGIIGLGRIGQAVATRLEALGCTVGYHNRRQVPDVSYAYAASPVELAASVDSLVVVVPGGSATDALVDREVLDALGPEGVLVNIARGSVVDQPALVAALQEGRLGGAGLDVYADEPNVPAELMALDNVVLLPHVASGTHVTRAAMRDLALANLDAWLADGTLRTPIPEMGRQRLSS
jgi:lactate dehydrogenase-like 2-hydroxyacid dehydrogenase